MSSLLKLAQTLNYIEKLFTISLGQGQGPAAESLIEKGRHAGHWVFLQNCHLATSWMPAMEKIVRDIALGIISAHQDFRLFLSSVPAKSFPQSVLQNSLKLTNESPKGLRTNLIRTLSDMDKNYFENHILGKGWRAMVFGICFFHGIVLERRKFGPLGWNIFYDFSDSDRECGLAVLEMYCDRLIMNDIPWDALQYINGEITWGGRVTDYWDQRCLKTILKVFVSSKILNPAYKYSQSGIYHVPDGENLIDFQEYVSGLPFNDNPEIFGMHANANIVFETNETNFFISTLEETSPSSASSTNTSGMSNDDICMNMIQKISKALVKQISTDDILPSMNVRDAKNRIPPLTTVLMQEIDRFNNLLRIVHKSLSDLQKAIKGFIVMSDSLESIYNSFINNQIPRLWSSKGYLSSKSLANWLRDFQYRIDLMQVWVREGVPRSTWISGLYFPQSFLTGALQRHSRLYNIPIDSLKIDFEIMPQTILQSELYDKHQMGIKECDESYGNLSYPNEGAYIHGLFIEGARWDEREGGLTDSIYGELLPNLPVLWLKPCLSVDKGERYEAPLYKTQVRAGVLSTTGHSTNFVLPVLLPSHHNSDYWILKGAALLTMTTE